MSQKEVNYHTTINYRKNKESWEGEIGVVMHDGFLPIQTGDLYKHRTGGTDFQKAVDHQLQEGEYRVFERLFIVRPTYHGTHNISVIIYITDK